MSVKYPIHYNCFIDCENREFIREIVKHPNMYKIFISEDETDPTEDIINSENKTLLEVLIDLYDKRYMLIIRDLFDRGDFSSLKKRIDDKVGNTKCYFSIYCILGGLTYDMNIDKQREYLRKIEEDFPDIVDEEDYQLFIRHMGSN